MTLPPLYREGLTQRALGGEAQLNVYKLGLVEAILKEALSASTEQDSRGLGAGIRTALEVVRWEMPRRHPPG